MIYLLLHFFIAIAIGIGFIITNNKHKWFTKQNAQNGEGTVIFFIIFAWPVTLILALPILFFGGIWKYCIPDE